MTRSLSNLIKYQFVDLHPSDTVKINNNDKKDNFIPLGKDGGISIETIGQQEAEKAILSLQKKENNEAEPENISEEEYEKSKSFLTVQLKALLARDLFNENRYYYQVLNSMNPCVRKAYEILNTPSDYQMILREND